MTKAAVEIGDQVFGGEGAEAFGAVRQIRSHELVVDIEGSGEAVIPAGAVISVHDGKVVVDVALLSADVQVAIGRAHSREEKGL
jgi:hypothetical protein